MGQTGPRLDRTVPGSVGRALSRQYVKLCDLSDFRDAELLQRIRELLPERDPEAHVERKAWEMAMLEIPGVGVVRV